MESIVAQRIKEILKEKGVSANSLASKTDMQQVTVSRQLRGDNPVSCALIEGVLETFPDVSAEWLMRGKGEMYVKNVEAHEPEDKKVFATTNSSLWEKVVIALTDTCADQREQISRLKQLQDSANGQ